MRDGTAWGGILNWFMLLMKKYVGSSRLGWLYRSQEALLAAWLPLKGELRFMFFGNFKNTI